jgi:nucleotide-binding universal stress UspA family protein
MREPEQKRVVVGVAPTRDHDAALEYAAAEAVRRGVGVHVVLVRHPHWPGPDGLVDVELVGDDLVNAHTALLMQCEERLEKWTDDAVPVTTEVSHGGVVASLVAAARGAELVVLQHHRMTRPHHLPTLSVTNGVATRLRVPLVAVPDDWHETPASDAPVVAAIENAALSGLVAQEALSCARRTASEVHLLRAWSYADDLSLDDPVFRTATTEEWEAHVRTGLESELADLTAAYPDVPSLVRVVHGQPAYILARLTALSRLLVIGRHGAALPHGSHLGPVTRAVLSHGRCPVMVVDAGPVGAGR